VFPWNIFVHKLHENTHIFYLNFVSINIALTLNWYIYLLQWDIIWPLTCGRGDALSLFRTGIDSCSSYADPSDRGLVSSVSLSNFNSFSRICKEISHVLTLPTTLISCSPFKTLNLVNWSWTHFQMWICEGYSNWFSPPVDEYEVTSHDNTIQRIQL
jgi:hypothetical protein